MSYWVSFIQHLKSEIMKYSREEYPLECVGCTRAEIENIMKTQGVSFLPEVYKEFMLQMGRGISGWVVNNIVWNYPMVLQYKTPLDAENLGMDIVIFGEDHSGCGFVYFHTALEDSDPPVYLWWEDKDIRRLNKRLSGWLVDEITS